MVLGNDGTDEGGDNPFPVSKIKIAWYILPLIMRLYLEFLTCHQQLLFSTVFTGPRGYLAESSFCFHDAMMASECR